MPNRMGATLKGKVKGRRKAADPTLDEIISDSEQETTEVTSATDTERPEVPDFTSLIEDAPADYKPNRSPAGRTRIPSQFDDLLPRLYEEGKQHGPSWKRIPHDGNVEVDENGKATADSVKNSNAHIIKRELQKAQHFLGLGMDLNITKTHVEFKVRDLQKRKNADGTEIVDENEDDGSEADVED
jgi:hypothetical protein